MRHGSWTRSGESKCTWGLVLQLTASQQHTAAGRAYIVCAVDDVLVHLNNQSYQLIHGTARRQLTICKLQLFLCNAALWMEWNSHKFVADGPGTGPVR